MMDDDAIRLLVRRLARQHRSGGEVIERAAIMAEGGDSAAILAWIASHDGRPEAPAPAPSGRGLHSARPYDNGAGESTPRRYVLPPGVLS